MFTLQDFKKQVEKRGTRNLKFVKIKSDRRCRICNTLLKAGTVCLTINVKFQPRAWQCDDCLERRLDLLNARANKASIAFDDEGGYIAADDWESEALDALYEHGDYEFLEKYDTEE